MKNKKLFLTHSPIKYDLSDFKREYGKILIV